MRVERQWIAKDKNRLRDLVAARATRLDMDATVNALKLIVGKGDILYLSAFDNGDGRGLGLNLLRRYDRSRSVIYKIDQKNKTVQQESGNTVKRGNSGLAR
ncbi:aryl-sulfate sulfotransferase [Salmonella enterica subsp. enterica]|nr:aryl-sulfate sulfotransferase [Salmonella enterica subsp. enterica]